MAVAADFLPAAVSVADTLPAAAGLNCTVTVHDLPGPRLVPEHPSAVTVNAAAPGTVTARSALADPPVFFSVNTCEAAWPTVICW